MSIRGRRRNSDHQRYTSYFMKQHVHMIAPRTKSVSIDCNTCHGTGTDGYFQPCSECDGDGKKTYNLTLFEYVGDVEIAGCSVTAGGKTYSVRYFDLFHIPEMVRAEESKRRWDAIDVGRRPMSDANWSSNIPEDCLFSSIGLAMDVAYENNLDILQGFTKTQALAILKLFDEHESSTVTPSVDSSGALVPKELLSDPPETVEMTLGEYPMLTFETYSQSMQGNDRIVTESDFRKRHADVKIETALT